MKAIITILVYPFILYSCAFSMHAQNANITIGRGTNCFGRGTCSIELVENSKTTGKFNAVFALRNNQLVLRIFRVKLTENESAQILGQPITIANMDSLNLVMDETIAVPIELQQVLYKTFGMTITQLKHGAYITNISEEIIEIILLE